MSTEQTEAAEPAQPSGTKYGVQVTVNSAVLRETELGSFEGSDFEGRLSRTTVRERIHGTDAPGVEAVSYSFEQRRTGLFSTPALWSFLSILSSSFILGLFGYRILYPELDLGLPVSVYYGALILIFLISKLMETRRIKRFVALSVVAKTLANLEETYGRAPIIDLPTGRLAEVRSAVEAALKPFPRLPSLVAAAQPSEPTAPAVADQRGELHGNLS